MTLHHPPNSFQESRLLQLLGNACNADQQNLLKVAPCYSTLNVNCWMLMPEMQRSFQINVARLNALKDMWGDMIWALNVSQPERFDLVSHSIAALVFAGLLFDIIDLLYKGLKQHLDVKPLPLLLSGRCMSFLDFAFWLAAAQNQQCSLKPLGTNATSTTLTVATMLIKQSFFTIHHVTSKVKTLPPISGSH